MPTPAEPDPDHEIKRLFTDKEPAKRISGLELLDKTYRYEITGFIRYLNQIGCVKLISHEPSDIWQWTLISVASNVVAGKFKCEGNLRTYLRTIAYRRAIDQMRKDSRFESTDFSDHQLEGVPLQNVDTEITELTTEKVRMLKHEVRMLKPTLQIVMETDIDLFLEDSKWPTLEKLTSEVNRLFPKESLSPDAIRGRRSRGRTELQRLLGLDIFDEPADSEDSDRLDDSIRPEDSHGRRGT